MSRRTRLMLFTVAAAGLSVALAVAFAGLRPFGAPASAYARILNALSVPQRHATDVVSAVSFDYRGIDTLFEEFILFAAIAGISILLRPLADETRQLPEDEAPDRRIPPPSPTVGLLAVVVSPLLVVVGLETVTHGQISPGGGFQGGVVLASAVFVVYLATSYARVERFEAGSLVEGAEGLGAGGYVVVGVVALIGGSAYLTNVIGLGHAGNFVSGGTLPIINAVVGVEVAAGFVLLGQGVPRPDGSHQRIRPVSVLAFGVVIWLFVVGLYGIVTSRNLIHLVICLSVAQSATDVFILEIGYVKGGHAPVFVGLSDHPGPTVDAIMQALALTDVVLGAAVSALLLALAIQIEKRVGSLDPDDLRTTNPSPW